MTTAAASAAQSYDASRQSGLAPGRPRIMSLDVIRGIVMVLMAVDHVRVYSGVSAGGSTAGVFFTRWITHFCAPAFVFLAGTAAYLYGQSIGGDKRALAKYLVTRGALLVLLELTVIKMSWTFNADYSQFILFGVIWMLGWCMILMGALVWLPTKAIAVIGLVLIFGQNLIGGVFGGIRDSAGAPGIVLDFLYLHGQDQGSRLQILYVIIPWIGVMMTGYAFGAIMTKEPAERRKLCLWIGGVATAAFVLIAGLSVALQPAQDTAAPALFRMLNQRKYPASQLFLLMTLGPTILAVPFLERARGWLSEMLATFGRVPMFYYLLHIPLIHLLALAVMGARGGSGMSEWYSTAPYTAVPSEHRWSLPLLYAVFVAAVALLYSACAWYARLKSRRRYGWLKYI